MKASSLDNTESTKESMVKFLKCGAITSDKVDVKSIVKNDMQNCLNEISDIKIQVEELTITNHATVDQLKAKCSKLNERFMALLNRLSFNSGSDEEPIHKFSLNKTPELQELLSTLHIIDAQRLVPIDIKSWNTPYSHYASLARIIGGTNIPGCDYIAEIIQLPPVEDHGRLRYPVNVMYFSPLKRQLAVKNIQQYCNKKKISLPIQYSLFRYPTLKHNVHVMSNILRDLQDKGKIEFYHINDFMATNYFDFLAPMFIIKRPGADKPTEYKECPTNSLYHSGLYISEHDVGMTSDEYLFFKQTIHDFVSEGMPQDRQDTDNNWTEVTDRRNKKVDENVQVDNFDVIREDSKIYRPTNQPKQINNKFQQRSVNKKQNIYRSYSDAVVGSNKGVKSGGGGGKGVKSGGGGGKGVQAGGQGGQKVTAGDNSGGGNKGVNSGGGDGTRGQSGGVGGGGVRRRAWAKDEGFRPRVLNYSPTNQFYSHQNKAVYTQSTPPSRNSPNTQQSSRPKNKQQMNHQQNINHGSPTQVGDVPHFYEENQMSPGNLDFLLQMAHTFINLNSN